MSSQDDDRRHSEQSSEEDELREELLDQLEEIAMLRNQLKRCELRFHDQKRQTLQHKLSQNDNILDECQEELEGSRCGPQKTTNPNAGEVGRWLGDVVKLPQYLDLLIADGFDDKECVLTLTDCDLLDMGITKKGHRNKILKHLETLRVDYCG